MKKVPFEECEAALDCLKNGQAIAVEINLEGFEKYYRDCYLRQLGYDPELKRKYTPTATVLQEIGNMPGHYVVIGHNEIVCGLHGDIFYVDPEDFIEY